MTGFIRPCEGRFVSPFGMRLHPVYKDMRMHWGIDLASDGSPTIKAAAAGKVVKAREASTDGYGKVVFVEHLIGGKLFTTVYAHLRSINVKVNHQVRQGQQIGIKGNTGVGTGVHLHFEVHTGKWNNKFTNAVDPAMYLPLEVSLKRGDVGPNVTIVQKDFVKAGHLSKVDGIFGPGMHTAVISFQNVHRLTPDGIVGPGTLNALSESIKPKEVVKVSQDNKPLPVSASHKPAWDWAKQKGFLNGENPRGSLTREQFATVLKRLYEDLKK